MSDAVDGADEEPQQQDAEDDEDRRTPSPWSFIRTAAVTLVSAIIEADRQVDAAGDDDDRLGDRGERDRQDPDRQALDLRRRRSSAG